MDWKNAEHFKKDSREERARDEKGRLFEAVAVLEKPLSTILESLRPSLEQGEFDTIIGDDASGRIPTLILRKVIGEIYGRAGRKGPDTLFFAGGGSAVAHEKKTDIKDPTGEITAFLEKRPSKKVLVVTDTIVTGVSLIPLTTALRKTKIKYEVATVGLDPSGIEAYTGITPTIRQMRNSFQQTLQGKVHHGDSPDTPAMYEWSKVLGGVYKMPGDLHSKTLRGETKPKDRPLLQAFINEARTDVDIIADILIDKYYANQIES